MNVLACVRLYPPAGGAGAEWYLHELLVALVKRGHDCYVEAAEDPGAAELDGVMLGGQWDAPDVVIGQIDGAARARQAAASYHVPFVHIAHSHLQLGHLPQLQLVNSEHVAAAAKRWGPCQVLRPHVPRKRYWTRPYNAHHVTLMNLSQAKGGDVFYELARRMPERGFIGVLGAWDVQLPAPDLSNLAILPNTADVREVYKRTRVLLMPSVTESWGRCAVEAAHSGVPTIARPTDGVWEAMGSAAVYAWTVDDYQTALTCLDEPAEYVAYSDAAARRAHALERVTARDLDLACTAIEDL